MKKQGEEHNSQIFSNDFILTKRDMPVIGEIPFNLSTFFGTLAPGPPRRRNHVQVNSNETNIFSYPANKQGITSVSGERRRLQWKN
jgi:hypothetical protein